MCRFNGRETAAAASSNYPHVWISLGKLGEALVAVAGSPRDPSNLVVELWEGVNWTRVEDFPHADGDAISHYSTVTVEDTMLIIGVSFGQIMKFQL